MTLRDPSSRLGRRVGWWLRVVERNMGLVSRPVAEMKANVEQTLGSGAGAHSREVSENSKSPKL